MCSSTALRPPPEPLLDRRHARRPAAAAGRRSGTAFRPSCRHFGPPVDDTPLPLPHLLVGKENPSTSVLAATLAFGKVPNPAPLGLLLSFASLGLTISG